MSSELERELRAAREMLPEPSPEATERARAAALAATRARRSGRMRTAAVAAVLIVLALLAVGFAGASFLRQPFAVTAPQQSRVLDRTYACAHRAFGDVEEVQTRAGTGIRETRSTWKQLPYAAAQAGRSTSSPYSRWGELTFSYAWITAGAPSRTTRINNEWRDDVGVPATLAVSSKACRPASKRIPLSRAGLSGSAASPFGEEFDCRTPRRFLVRVRAVFAGRTTLRSRDGFLATRTPAREAQLAVRTEKGKPLVYAEVRDSGKASLFTANGCVRE
jgi:hypothetical protein